MMFVRVKDFLRFAVLTLLAVGALAGCSTFEVAPAAQPVVTAPAPRKPATHEIGSLWSDDSAWNHVYAAAAARMPGDIVTVRLDDAFRKRVARFKEGGNETADRGLAGDTDLSMKASIEEVGPRGVYRIIAADNLRMGDWEPFVTLRGRVRDKDISSNDEILIANVVDLGFDVRNNAPTGDEEKGAQDVSW